MPRQLAPYTFSLAGRTALVTGGSGHLGGAISKGLATAGAFVHIVGRNKEKMEMLVAEIESGGGKACFHCVDLLDAAARSSLIKSFSKSHSSLEILVNNAYQGDSKSWRNTSMEDYLQSYEISVVAVADLVGKFFQAMKRASELHGDSSIINVASMYGHVSPDPKIYGDSGMDSPPNYAAAKGAMIQYTRYAAAHFASEGIRVNAVSPGPMPKIKVRTEQPDFCARLIGKVPLGRLGTPDDIVGPILFLASTHAQYVTGINLCVDGGWTAC